MTEPMQRNGNKADIAGEGGESWGETLKVIIQALLD
jgi:hypothetical protein